VDTSGAAASRAGRGRRSVVGAVLLVLLAAGAPPAGAVPSPSGEPTRWVVTEQGPDGPRFTSVVAPSARAALRRTDGATSVEPDVRVQVPDAGPVRRAQWALERVGFERAWTVTRGAGVVVAVVDTGVDPTHPDLAGRVLEGWTFAGAGDRSRRGQRDGHGHGTHVAGILAADPRGGRGLSGGAPGVRVLPVRVVDEDGIGWSSDIASGIVWAADNGARVLNVSLGTSRPSRAVTAAVEHARRRGAVVVAAAGNDGEDGPLSYPAAQPGVLAVGAVDPGDDVVPFSSTGPHLGLVAPGLSVLSSVPVSVDRSRLARASGTSMAAPHVSAAAALVRAREPRLPEAGVVARLLATAQDLGAPGRDDRYGAGLVDPARAVGVAPVPPPVRLPAPGGLRFDAAADGAATLSWRPVAGAATYAVLSEGLPLNLSVEEGGEPVYVLRGTTARFVRFPRGRAVPLQVVAVDTRGLWSPRSPASRGFVPARVLEAPRGVTGSSPGSRTVRLSWQPVGDPELAFYGILRNGELHAIVEPAGTRFTDSVASSGSDAPYDGRRYSYRVVAITDDLERGDASAAVVVRSWTRWATTAPRLSTAAAPRGVAVRWSPAVRSQRGWRVYVDGDLHAVLPVSARSWTVTAPGRHTVTVARYRAAHDQGPPASVPVTVAARR
jgi:type VII secretion-associated serine protease mycosin